MFVAGATGETGGGLAAGAGLAGDGLFAGVTILRVNCRADCAGELVTSKNETTASEQIREAVFIAV